jgi:hypothetical protein
MQGLVWAAVEISPTNQAMAVHAALVKAMSNETQV